MLPNSPLEYLIAFALAFAGGVLAAMYYPPRPQLSSSGCS